jgi:prevent-host-death family protein
MDRTVSIAELKARLSEYIAAARAGDAVVITQHGRPVARLTPLTGTGAREGRMAELVRNGLVREPRKKLSPSFLNEVRPLDTAGRSIEITMEERAEGW